MNLDESLAEKEKSLAEKEKSLVEKEKSLVEKEKSLVEEKEKSLVDEEELGVEMKKPFDPSQIRVREIPMNIDSVIKRMEHNEINLDATFQRKQGLWKDEQQSRLIESILIRFPLPVFYFDGRNPDNWSVIDGLQRLTSLKRFVLDKDLKLRGLEFLSDLNDKTWGELGRPKQRQINESILQCYIIEEGQEEVVFNIFKRINTGGLLLTSQEIRNVMHQDVASYLKQLAESAEFKEATNDKIKPERMLDRDFVNRFLAFYLLDYRDDSAYKGNLDLFMNTALDKLGEIKESSGGKEKLKDIETRFKAAMKLSKTVFEEAAFCKNKGHRRINKALFEVISVSFAKLSDAKRAKILENKTAFEAAFYNAISENFSETLKSGTAKRSSIDLRYKIFNQLIDEKLNL